MVITIFSPSKISASGCFYPLPSNGLLLEIIIIIIIIIFIIIIFIIVIIIIIIIVVVVVIIIIFTIIIYHGLIEVWEKCQEKHHEKSHPVHTKSVCISSGKKVERIFT